jgi:hypothetical protein
MRSSYNPPYRSIRTIPLLTVLLAILAALMLSASVATAQDEGFFGTVAFVDETHVIYGHEPLRRSYTSFEAAAEAAISRLYGGDSLSCGHRKRPASGALRGRSGQRHAHPVLDRSGWRIA